MAKTHRDSQHMVLAEAWLDFESMTDLLASAIDKGCIVCNVSQGITSSPS